MGKFALKKPADVPGKAWWVLQSIWDFIQTNWLRPAICIGLFVAFGGVLFGSESTTPQRHLQTNTASKI